MNKSQNTLNVKHKNYTCYVTSNSVLNKKLTINSNMNKIAKHQHQVFMIQNQNKNIFERA